MSVRQRVVLDTNAFISRLLSPDSVPAQAVSKAVDTADILGSEATMSELADVLSRPKFDPYVSVEERQQFFRLLVRLIRMIPIVRRVRVCRDPDDDKILELAINGNAHSIITGDRDLLSLKQFETTKIVTPAAYIRE
ncbi:MAG TPA: putative toxin-antitoxin system toxin component, PIN family [Terriglobales bacterium]|nr:putative toxin-antitoxin system toxin component, PIN family [Terriglobales bacterium]